MFNFDGTCGLLGGLTFRCGGVLMLSNFDVEIVSLRATTEGDRRKSGQRNARLRGKLGFTVAAKVF